ncbi:MAG: radical SAM protein [Myxococcales bacterium]|nr:radical SAM protein [Myxococcales bacterium]MCB9577649.1 radical SAM protein [Polyangiaceae bacterium]
MKDRPRVLLIWPGGLFGGGANFGVPQLLMIASAIRRASDAIVEVVDFDMERAFGPIDLARVVAGGYDLVGISCYSSYDYLKVMAIGARLRELLPRAWLVTGGYHPSARPEDFTAEDSPFDFVVVGDGERPMARLASAVESGRRPLMRVLGPDSVPDPAELVPYDWSLLERYRPIARRVASQAEIYLSRGCPFDCAFCMERAKRDVSWRALDPETAVEEMQRLDRFLDLSQWTLFVADALFGMKRGWRRQFLTELARRPLRARKIWLLIRVDLIEREDLELMARANVSPGFGLESGDPEQLTRIRKAGRLKDYLEKMLEVASWARELGVPFGANIIVGHPGETESTLRTSAAYLRRLFLEPEAGTHGFLSVDPFRLYPGSPIDEERVSWEASTGMRVHRYPWWHDGDQDFLSEWVDPSTELDFRRVNQLRHELFGPIVRGIEERFAYQGSARDYYLRAVREQVELGTPRRRLHTLGLWHLWRGLNGSVGPADRRAALEDDSELSAVAKSARAHTLEGLRPEPDAPLADALLAVPRERFVDVEHIGASADDRALPLSEDGGSTLSALHAYVVAFSALSLAEGDSFVDLGAGTGYGAALASQLVGETGSVLAIELSPDLAERARQNVPRATVLTASAHDTKLWGGRPKVFAGFAVQSLPEAWLAALPVGGELVVPVGSADSQKLVHVRRLADGHELTELGSVRYVPDRRPPA